MGINAENIAGSGLPRQCTEHSCSWLIIGIATVFQPTWYWCTVPIWNLAETQTPLFYRFFAWLSTALLSRSSPATWWWCCHICQKWTCLYQVSSPAVNLECLTLKLCLPKRKSLVVVSIYKPPSENIESFLDSLDDVLSSLCKANLLLVGDFNAKHSSWYPAQETDTQGSALKMLRQLVKDPT